MHTVKNIHLNAFTVCIKIQHAELTMCDCVLILHRLLLATILHLRSALSDFHNQIHLPNILIFDQSVAVRSFPQISERRTQSPRSSSEAADALETQESFEEFRYLHHRERQEFLFSAAYCTGSTS